jgi:hypothetical protein
MIDVVFDWLRSGEYADSSGRSPAGTAFARAASGRRGGAAKWHSRDSAARWRFASLTQARKEGPTLNPRSYSRGGL